MNKQLKLCLTFSGSAQFPEDISSWLKCSGIGKDKIHDSDNPYDIIAIGTQVSKISKTLIKCIFIYTNNNSP